jgi:dolichol-phosphate mannosyltransferase
MPLIRHIGNMGLGFLTKAATGYWNFFGPTNGYVAVRGEILAQLFINCIDNTFFFETSMLANLYLLGVVVKDVPMLACYYDESSNISARRTLIEFPFKLMRTFLRRLMLKN